MARVSEPWRLDAACRQHPTEWWFGNTRERIRAGAVCRGCEVRTECLEYALAHPAMLGIWAATTGEERTRLRLARSARAPFMPAQGSVAAQ